MKTIISVLLGLWFWRLCANDAACLARRQPLLTFRIPPRRHLGIACSRRRKSHRRSQGRTTAGDRSKLGGANEHRRVSRERSPAVRQEGTGGPAVLPTRRGGCVSPFCFGVLPTLGTRYMIA